MCGSAGEPHGDFVRNRDPGWYGLSQATRRVIKPAPAAALPRGFRFAAVNCGLRKPPNLDLGLILADEPAAAAGIFTQNLVQAAPVLLSREHLRANPSAIRAVIVNSRNANCATGP